MVTRLRIVKLIGSRLRAMRERMGFSQQDLADRAGVHLNQVYKWENERAMPGADMLARLSRELNVSSDYLLGLVDEPQGEISPYDLSPLEHKFLSAADHGDLEEMIKVALEIYKDYMPEQNMGTGIPPFGATRKAGKSRTAKAK